MNKARLEEIYNTNIRSELKNDLELTNIMQVPTVTSVVLNVGVKEAVGDSKALKAVVDGLTKISGQRPVRTLARKSIAGFKLREGSPIGVKVTLRRKRMWEFLDRLINLALPKVRDFQGVTTKCDGRGNYNLGVKEWTIFPELEYEVGDAVYGMNISIVTNTKDDNSARLLLEKFGMPFKRSS